MAGAAGSEVTELVAVGLETPPTGAEGAETVSLTIDSAKTKPPTRMTTARASKGMRCRPATCCHRPVSAARDALLPLVVLPAVASSAWSSFGSPGERGSADEG
ncbi:hypothetical protein ACFY3M_51960 [Streptomyces mirabilis]|uniref:hypothetical protein n=1 Tax=Streptomyces mirabilis TaxID=68239 RepID=UPI00368EFA3A